MPLGASSSGSIRPTRPSCRPPTPSISTTCCCTSPRCCAKTPRSAQSLDERYRYILVDEYQDTNLAQYAIARALSIDHPNLAVTGDPDQSIYGWRGANLNNILEFENDFPDVHVVRLEQNYRSTKRILRVAAELISPQPPAQGEGPLYGERRRARRSAWSPIPRRRDEAEDIAAQIAGEIRAGRRPAARFRHLLPHQRPEPGASNSPCATQGVPYQMVHGLEFFQRKEIKDILAYLQLLNNPHDETALLRVINTPPRGIGKTTIERLAALRHAPRHGPAGSRPAGPQHRGDQRRGRAGTWPSSSRMFDRLAAVAAGPLEEMLGLVLTETGYEEQWKDSDDAEDDERLANIQELLTVAREFDERHPRRRPWRPFWKRPAW